MTVVIKKQQYNKIIFNNSDNMLFFHGIAFYMEESGSTD